MQNKNLKPVSFFDAAITLAELCERIDNEQDLGDALVAQFESATKSLEESIDRRKYVYKEAEAKIRLARSYKEELDRTIKKLEKIQDKIEQNTRQMVESKPDLPFKDSLGNKLSIRKNSIPALNLNIDLRSSKSVSNILDQTSIEFLGIDPKYIEHVSYLTLNTEALKKDLESGVELPWASVNYGTHLRGLK